MINSLSFISKINSIQEFRDEQCNAMTKIYNALHMDGHPIMNFGSKLIDDIIDLLSMSFDSGDNIKEMEDIEDLIVWFLYDKPKENATIKHKGIIYIINTAEDLYNLICVLFGKMKI